MSHLSPSEATAAVAAFNAILAGSASAAAATPTRLALAAAIRDGINACPDRGGVLPISQQREGCKCGELSECRRLLGQTPGRVSLRECIACVEAKIEGDDESPSIVPVC